MIPHPTPDWLLWLRTIALCLAIASSLVIHRATIVRTARASYRSLRHRVEAVADEAGQHFRMGESR